MILIAEYNREGTQGSMILITEYNREGSMIIDCRI